MYSHMTTFRFNILNSNLNEEMIEFAHFHKHTNSSLFKESFDAWCKSGSIASLIHEEEKRLFNENYNFHKNNIYTKIFKSIKYYHIKRLTAIPLYIDTSNDGLNVAQERRLPLQEDTKEDINEDTKEVTKEENSSGRRFRSMFLQLVKTHIANDFTLKPSLSFDSFCTTYKKEIEEEIKYTCYDAREFMLKMKKMFKNQFYQLSKQNI